MALAAARVWAPPSTASLIQASTRSASVSARAGQLPVGWFGRVAGTSLAAISTSFQRKGLEDFCVQQRPGWTELQELAGRS